MLISLSSTTIPDPVAFTFNRLEPSIAGRIPVILAAGTSVSPEAEPLNDVEDVTPVTSNPYGDAVTAEPTAS